MERANLADKLARRPFVPFRVVTSSGESYTIYHPDAAILIRTRLVAALPGRSLAESDRVADVSLLHITAVEDVRAAEESSAT